MMRLMNTKHKILAAAPRTILGLIFFVFGLNGFLHFLPTPPLEGGAAQLMGAFAASGYMFPLIKGTEVLAGLALLSNRFTALALVALAPITVNILAFHLALAPAGMGLTALVLGLHLGSAWQLRNVYRPLLRAQVDAEEQTSPRLSPATA